MPGRLGAWTLGFVLVVAGCSPVTEDPRDDDLLGAVEKAAEWLRSTSIEVDSGEMSALRWPADPLSDDGSDEESLYSTTPGVVLFFAEYARFTGAQEDVDTARRGAEWLLDDLSQRRTSGEGLYVGRAGLALALLEVAELTGDERYGSAVDRFVAELAQTAERGRDAAGREIVTWSDTTDIISGTAGTGLFLMDVHRRTGSEQAAELAVGAALWLQAQAVESGAEGERHLKWRVAADVEKLYPNFSHGTAGIAYFLAQASELAGDTRDELLQTAIAGGHYLTSIADGGGDFCLVFHHEPGGEGLHYLSWCHGPAGTARLFYALWTRTGDEEWREWMRRSGQALLDAGVPEQQTPGFWNNVSQCCGTAGVLDFALSMETVLGEDAYRELAERSGRQLLAEARSVDSGVNWPQAENRTQPEVVVAQTGWMQGAAGMAGALLRLHAVASQEPVRRVRLPDDPYDFESEPDRAPVGSRPSRRRGPAL
ncbi:MAG: lanthionine synthetase LanC family protein [Acidobacteriota bacterium]